MDADGLPIVGTGIDFTKVGAIHQKRTLAFLNHFISHTARFLNRFSCVCEEKLETLSIRLLRLETTMSLLEAKLASVPGLENVTVPTTEESSAPQSSGDSQQSTPAAAYTPTEPTPATQGASAPPSTHAPQEEEAPAAAEAAPTVTVCKDPRYARFFKMLHVGVPAPAVKIKMVTDGLNPDLLDTPDAPAPPADQAASADNGDAEISSEEEAGSSDDEDDDSSGFSD